jgi:hypothetical protein
MTLRPALAIGVLVLVSLACGQYVPTVTPTAQVTPEPQEVATQTATLPPTPSPVPTAADVADTVIVKQPIVRVRDAADGDPTGDYVTAGQEVNVLEYSEDGDWARIAEPPGWVWAGCLEGVNDKGCEAAK